MVVKKALWLESASSPSGESSLGDVILSMRQSSDRRSELRGKIDGPQ